MKCEKCKKELAQKELEFFHYAESGIESVFLKNIRVFVCIECDVHLPAIPMISLLHETIARAIVSKPNALTGGELRFLRGQLRLKAQEWAKLLHITKETLSRCESDIKPFGPQTDLLARLMFVRMYEERNSKIWDDHITEALSKAPGDQMAIVIDSENVGAYEYTHSADAHFFADEAVRKLTASVSKFRIPVPANSLLMAEVEQTLSPANIVNVSGDADSFYPEFELAAA